MLLKVLLGCFAIASTLVYGQELTCGQVSSLANQYFSGPDVANNMVCISYYESSFNASALNPSGATGLWQIMEGHCQGICQGICSTQEDLYNPVTNAQCAVAVYNSQGYDAWTTYANGDCDSWSGCSSISGSSNSGSSNSGSSNSGNGSNSGSSNSGSSNSGNSNSGSGTGSGTGSQEIKGGYFDTGSSASSSTGLPPV